MQRYGSSTYGDGFADVYDDWYGDVTDAEACARHLARLVDAVGPGPVLELGVGTGRLALPLAALGVEVHGIDASTAMLDALRRKPGGEAIRTVHADMADLHPIGATRFAVVLVAFNTFFNLADRRSQERCLQGVANLLAPDGRFVLEAFVPNAEPPTIEPVVSTRRITDVEVVLSVSQVDPVAQTILGQHIHLRDGHVRLRPWHLRYAPPDELDAMASAAGLVLERRRGGWHDEPFTDASGVHVSTYRRGNVRAVRDQSAPQR